MFWLLILLSSSSLLTIIAFAWYKYLTKPHKYWIERGVKQTQPTFLFGDSFGALFHRESFGEMLLRIYNAWPNTRYTGMYQFLQPALFLKDPELIKQITVKDFDYFVDRRPFLPPEADRLWSQNLFALRGEEWRDMRSTLSPAFTSSKMRQMFVLMLDSARQFTDYYDQLIRKNDGNVVEIELKDSFTRFTNDVIATTAFGIECDSLKNRENQFYLMAKELTSFAGIGRQLRFFGYLLFPGILAGVFKLKFFGKTERNFFIELVKQTIETREKLGIVRPDMMNLLMEARKHRLEYEEDTLLGNKDDAGFATVEESHVGRTQNNKNREKREITIADITSQALIFLFAGFDSVSTLMCFMAYELGINPDIQDRLRQEIDDAISTTNTKEGAIITYEELLKMKYLDMVVSETLRKWPSIIGSDRICTKPYTIEPKNPDEKPIHLKINDVVGLPIIGLHRDSTYFPDPDRFDPDRFSDENRAKIVPYTYLPFGPGPRNCIGSRFALLEAKTIFVNLLAKFEIVPTKRTDIPLKMSRNQFHLTAQNGFWLGLKRRESKK